MDPSRRCRDPLARAEISFLDVSSMGKGVAARSLLHVLMRSGAGRPHLMKGNGRMLLRKCLLLVFVATSWLAVGGCSGSDSPTPSEFEPESEPESELEFKPQSEPPRSSMSIGQTGGTLQVEGVALHVPAGALQQDQMITVTVSAQPAPVGFRAASPVYHFEPAGLQFRTPATVEIAFSGPPDGLQLLWSGGGSNFAPIESVAVGQTLRGTVNHFSEGVAVRVDTTTQQQDAGTHNDASQGDARADADASQGDARVDARK